MSENCLAKALFRRCAIRVLCGVLTSGVQLKDRERTIEGLEQLLLSSKTTWLQTATEVTKHWLCLTASKHWLRTTSCGSTECCSQLKECNLELRDSKQTVDDLTGKLHKLHQVNEAMQLKVIAH